MSAVAIKSESASEARPNPNRNSNRKLMIDWQISQMDMSSNALRALMNIVNAYGNDGRIWFKRKTLATLCHLSLKQLDTALHDLKKRDLITTVQTGRCLQFFLGDIFWQDEKRLKVVPDSEHATDKQSSPGGESRVPLEGNSLIKSKRKILKTITAEPVPVSEPIPAPAEKSEKQEGPVGPVVEISKIRKKLPPKISMRVNDNTIKTLIGVEMEHIEYAARQAMGSSVANKVGLFLKLCREDAPEMARYKKREQVSYPTGPEVTQKQLDIIFCYNRNCAGAGCRTMQNKMPPGPNCEKYCPFVIDGKNKC